MSHRQAFSDDHLVDARNVSLPAQIFRGIDSVVGYSSVFSWSLHLPFFKGNHMFVKTELVLVDDATLATVGGGVAQNGY